MKKDPECPGDTIEKDDNGSKVCCEQSPNTNGECEQDYVCKCALPVSKTGHSIKDAGVSTSDGQSLTFPDGLLPGECGASESQAMHLHPMSS